MIEDISMKNCIILAYYFPHSWSQMVDYDVFMINHCDHIFINVFFQESFAKQ